MRVDLPISEETAMEINDERWRVIENFAHEMNPAGDAMTIAERPSRPRRGGRDDKGHPELACGVEIIQQLVRMTVNNQEKRGSE